VVVSLLVTHRRPSARRPYLIAGLILIGLAMAAQLGLHQPGATWVLLLPGGLLLLLGTKPAGPPVEAIVLDDFGVSDRSIDIGPIPWDQLVRAEVGWIRRFPVVALHLTDNAAWMARMPERHRKLVQLGAAELGLPPVFLYAVGLDVAPEEIVERINQRARGGPPK